MTNRTKSISQSFTVLAFLAAAFVAGCSGSSDDGGGSSGDGDASTGDGDSGMPVGDGDATWTGGTTGDGGDAPGSGATAGDGDGDATWTGGGAGDGDGDDRPSTGGTNGDGDGDAPVGPCELGDFAPIECGACGCGPSEVWECFTIPELCPTPCEGDNCCGGAAYPEFEPCQTGWQCVEEQWMCNPESDCPHVASNGGACLGVVVGASNPDTGTCCQFSSPCKVPNGWKSCGDWEIDPPVIEPPVSVPPEQPAN